ncbi:hypothetical protein O181_020272 [Austropuccinia psidii MF-1]|uniref:Uncharacterized protein n=1 Tax=Austropuccinia psidii MF-1 TaxID=1389203 RepID=A0A9Q3CD58_9BASI|nr:hypothetical protein [Austropuccinia psidii MF-1]
MEIDRKANFKFSEWAPGSSTPDIDHIGPEETETPKLGIESFELHNKLLNSVSKYYEKHKQCSILMSLLKQKYKSPELESQLEEPEGRDYKETFFIDGLLYLREKHTSVPTVIERNHVSLIL